MIPAASAPCIPSLGNPGEEPKNGVSLWLQTQSSEMWIALNSDTDYREAGKVWGKLPKYRDLSMNALWPGLKFFRYPNTGIAHGMEGELYPRCSHSPVF